MVDMNESRSLALGCRWYELLRVMVDMSYSES